MMSVNSKLSRTRIEEAAIEVFDLVGFHGAAARTVARRYDGAPGSIYYYFTSMNDLYVQSCLPRYREAIDFLTEPLNTGCSSLVELCIAVSASLDRLQKLSPPRAACVRIGFHEILRRDDRNPFRDCVKQRDHEIATRIRLLARGATNKSAPGPASAQDAEFRGKAAEILILAFRWGMFCFAVDSSVPHGLASAAGLYSLLSVMTPEMMPQISGGLPLETKNLSFLAADEAKTPGSETKPAHAKSKDPETDTSESKFPKVLAGIAPRRRNLSEELL